MARPWHTMVHTTACHDMSWATHGPSVTLQGWSRWRVHGEVDGHGWSVDGYGIVYAMALVLWAMEHVRKALAIVM